MKRAPSLRSIGRTGAGRRSSIGRVVLAITLLVMAPPAVAGERSASITLSPTVGPPTTTVTVQGSGFRAIPLPSIPDALTRAGRGDGAHPRVLLDGPPWHLRAASSSLGSSGGTLPVTGHRAIVPRPCLEPDLEGVCRGGRVRERRAPPSCPRRLNPHPPPARCRH